jgi:hypothetical protein
MSGFYSGSSLFVFKWTEGVIDRVSHGDDKFQGFMVVDGT